MAESLLTQNDKKYLKKNEFILYLVAVFFYTMMTGTVGAYRNKFLVDVIKVGENHISLFNILVAVIPFILNIFITMYIDGRKSGKSGKFRPLALLVAIPTGIFLVLSFWAPSVLVDGYGTSKLMTTLLMIYLTTVAVAWAVCTNFGDSVNKVAIVMTPNQKERDTVMSFRGIVSAVGNSAPLVVELVLALIIKSQMLLYIAIASLCGVCGIITMLLGMKTVRERVTYSNEKKNPVEGFADVLKNRYVWPIIISEFLKSFRGIATYMGIFLADALLGPNKFLLFGLPTGIGTAVGMLVINFLLKKFNSKQLYIASGIYSIIANTAAFAVGYTYFKNPSPVMQVVFVIFLFLIGLQFGASNLLPTMFQADALESIELDTGKRLDASLPFVIGIFTMISGTIASALAPQALLRESIIGYIQAPKGYDGYLPQTEHTKIMLLFFYTVVHGIMMFLAGVPFFFYKLTGKTKEDIHNAVLERREQLAKSQGDSDTAE